MVEIDWETIEFEFNDEMDIYAEIFQDYSDSWRKLIDQLEAALVISDYKSATIAAHTLKGVVSNFYCEEIRLVALEMEQECKLEEQANIPDLIEKYQELNESLLFQLSEFVKKNSIFKQAS